MPSHKALARTASPPKLPAGLNGAIKGVSLQQRQRDAFSRMEFDRAVLQADMSEAEEQICDLEHETRFLRAGEIVPGVFVEQVIAHTEHERAQEVSAHERQREELTSELEVASSHYRRILASELADADDDAAALRERIAVMEANAAAEASGLALADEDAATVNALIEDLLAGPMAAPAQHNAAPAGDAAVAEGNVFAPPPGWSLEQWLRSFSFDRIVSDAILKRVRARAPAGAPTAVYEQAFMLGLNERGSRELVVALLRETPVLHTIADRIIAGAKQLQDELDEAAVDLDQARRKRLLRRQATRSRWRATRMATTFALELDAHSPRKQSTLERCAVKLQKVFRGKAARQRLLRPGSSTAQSLNDDFIKAGAFTLSYSTNAALFWSGISRITGPPTSQLEVSVVTSMENEHLRARDSKTPYEANNYLYYTTSTVEWAFVTDPAGSEGSEAQSYVNCWPGTTGRDLSGSPREALPLSAFDEPRQKVDAKLMTLDEQAMSDAEMYALRLYTGPQFTKYNAVLRGAKADSNGPYSADLHRRFLELCQGNTYSNTLHVISAAISGRLCLNQMAKRELAFLLSTPSYCTFKLSKITPASNVYRAPGGALPASFWHRNAVSGVQGGLELGFMSTTSDKEEALKYARRAPGMVLFEVDQGFVARGASISWLSQYPQEAEVLYPPFTALEVASSRVEGAVVVVRLKPSLSSAVAASGLRTGADDIVAFEEQRERVRLDREKVKVTEELRMRMERQRIMQERARLKHELLYQQKLAGLRVSALQRKEAQTAARLADSRHDLMHLRWELASANSSRDEYALNLHAQVKAAMDVRKNATSLLKRADLKMQESHRNLVEALEAKNRLEKSVGRRLWTLLAKHVREQSKSANMSTRIFQSLTQQLRQVSAEVDMGGDDESHAAPSSAPAPGDDGIASMDAAELIPQLREWVGPQERWVAGKNRADTERTMQACIRLVEVFTAGRQMEAKKQRKLAMELGVLEILGFSLRKHVEEPFVLVHVYDALRALALKEKPSTVQKAGRSIIPAVINGAKTVTEQFFVTLVQALTKDNSDTTAYAVRVGCDVAWLAEDSNVPYEVGADGKVVVGQ